ncbi:MAG: alpha/beta hydrolase [DPANN group archaeon]|nr:alpha/beta hydrolase [DPANN group archaeon]
MEKQVMRKGLQVKYDITYGSKGTVVLLGGVRKHHLKGHLSDFFIRQDHTVIVPSLLVSDIAANLPQLSVQLQAVLDNEDIKVPVIIGLREGCSIAMAYSLEVPVKKLFLIDPVGRDFNRIDTLRALAVRMRLLFIRLLLWQSAHRAASLLFLECMDYERNILSINPPIILVEHEDIFTAHRGIKELQKLNPKLKVSYTTGNRLVTRRPYEIITRLMAYW